MSQFSENTIVDSIWVCSFANWKSFKNRFNIITGDNNIA